MALNQASSETAPVLEPAPTPDRGGSNGPSWRQGEIFFAIVLFVVAVMAFLATAHYPGMSGNYPRTLSVMLGIGAALVFVRAILRPGATAGVEFFIHLPRALLGFVALAIYIGAISVVGYLIPSLVLGIVLPLLLGYRNLWLAALVTLGTILFIVLVFFVVLERPLPPDLLQPVLEALR